MLLVDCHVHMYADDVKLYISTRKENIDSCLFLLNRNLDRIECWASANGLCINANALFFQEPMFRLSYLD